MAKQEHMEVVFSNLVVNKKNPRHPEFESERAAISYFCLSKSAKTKKLCQSIVNNGYFKDSILLVTKTEDEKFIVLDGNRRLTALKIMNNPALIPDAPECTSLKRLVLRNPLDDMEVHCFCYEDPSEARERIRSLHTNSETREEWDQIGQIRFDFANDIIPPLWFQLIEANDPSLFENINNTSTISRLFSRAVIDHYLPIDEDLRFRSPASLAKFQEIVADISVGSTTSRHLNSADARSLYLEDVFVSHLPPEPAAPALATNTIPENDTNSESANPLTGEPQITDNAHQSMPIYRPTPLSVTTDVDARTRSSNVFSDLRITFVTIDPCEERLVDGLTKVLTELNSLNNVRPRLFYLSKFILIRSMLEQSLKLWFYRNHREKYDVLSVNGGKDIRFEDLIKNAITMINASKPCFKDPNIDNMFKIIFTNNANKDLLDQMVHHPYTLNPTQEIIIFFSEGSVFHILNHILNWHQVANQS